MIAESLNKNITFNVRICKYKQRKPNLNKIKDKLIKIEVINKETDNIYLWRLDKFEHRFDMIQDLYQKYMFTKFFPVMKLLIIIFFLRFLTPNKFFSFDYKATIL